MDRRRFMQAVGASAAGLISARGAERKSPNVVFILADDLGIGGLNCYGSDWLETPHLDRLCKEGMKCTGGLAAFPVCKPSRAVLLTGQYAPRTGVYRVAERLAGYEDKIRFLLPPNGIVPPATPLINQPFKDAGYATAMYGKWHIGPAHKPGFHPTDYGFDDAVASEKSHYNAPSVPEIDIPEGVTIEEVLTTRAIGFMKKSVQNDQPFFLFMPYYWIHKPLEADPEVLAYFEEKLRGREWIGKHPDDVPMVAAMTKMLDDQCGRLFQALEHLGVADDTLVVFTSDNGSFNQNLVGPYRDQKGQVYDGGMRVPYLFKWPDRIKAGSETDERFIGVDLYPTLLSLAKLPKPGNHVLDGVNLAPLLLGETATLPDREIFCYFPKYARFNKRTKTWFDTWRNVIYDGNYKLIEYPELDEVELFNLGDDPCERKEISKAQPEKVQRLVAKLHRWLEEVDAPRLVPNPDFSLDD